MSAFHDHKTNSSCFLIANTWFSCYQYKFVLFLPMCREFGKFPGIIQSEPVCKQKLSHFLLG